MNRSEKFNFYLPQNTDPIDISNLDYNFEIIDENLITEEQELTSSQKANARANLDLGDAALQTVANNLTTTSEGSVLDARQGKALNDKSTANGNAVTALRKSIAIVSSGNTHIAITKGQYVYVHSHSSLSEGLYTANSNISANATLSTSNLTAVSKGAANSLISNIERAFAYGSTYEVDTGIIVSGSATMKRIRLYNTSASLGAGSFTKIGSIGANKWVLNMRGLFRVSTDANKAYTDGKYFQLRWDIRTGDIYVEQSWSNSSITCNVSITIDYFDSN